MAKISTARWNEMERIAAQDPETQFPVIITLKEGASPKSLEKTGFRMDHGAFNIVSGSASLDVLKKLRAASDVDLIEEDGEVRALGS
jgi:hypothetical protein